MNDILFGNNNQAIVRQLANNSFRANRRRNRFVIIALALTAFMITTVFSIGFSYFETYQLQQLRLMGTTADVAITNPTGTQLDELKQTDLISDIGISQRLGNVDTSQMEDILLGLVWVDDTEWKEHRLPTISDVHGSYPASVNEIMLPTWALERMGVTAPQIGMEIPMTYHLTNDNHNVTESFVLSGYYTDYVAARTEGRGSVYVSMDFVEVSGISSNSGVSAMISFANNNDVEKNCDKLKDKIDFTSSQTFEIVPVTKANSSTMIALIAVIAAFISYSGYLLIYNILYISISKDIRFYGQIKTIGATKKQIQKIVRQQVLKTSAIGIPIGLLTGTAVSLGVVPYALNMLYSSNADVGITISFSPLIFIWAAIVTLLTAIIGSRKPARIAGSISPIAALRYTEADASKTVPKTNRGIKLSRMAWRNIFRNRKGTTLVFISLFLGLCLFLVTVGILSSLSPENYVNQFGESDFVLTYSLFNEDAPISEETVSEVRQIDGVQNVYLTYTASPNATLNVVYDEAVFGAYIKSLDGKSGMDFSEQENVDTYTQDFYSGVYGIDREYVVELNKQLKNPIDTELFEKGEIVLLKEMLDDEGNPLIQPGQQITISTETGLHTFTVADTFLSADFQSGRGKIRGSAPDLYISQDILKEISPQYRIFRAAFNVPDQSDERVLRQLEAITVSSPEIEIISRYEKQAEMSGYITTTKVLGIGLSVILLLIGVMNFINTMVVSVNTRKHEFAVLESIGMTKAQIKRVLQYEGCYYWGVSFGLIATLGTGIYFSLQYFFKQQVSYAVYSYPVLPILLIAAIVLAICLAVPVWTYKRDLKDTVIERLRIE